MASEKIKDKIITIKILADAEGLRATDLTAAEPTKAITAAGPAVLKNITKIKAKVDMCLNLHEGDSHKERDSHLRAFV